MYDVRCTMYKGKMDNGCTKGQCTMDKGKMDNRQKTMDNGRWEISEHSLVNILSESHYTPGEFANALGAPSFMELLKSIQPFALPWIKALLKAKVYYHVPKLNRLFAKECGEGWFGKRIWEIESITFSYRSQTVDGRDTILSGRVTFLHHKDPSIPHQARTISVHTHQAFFDPKWAPLHNLMFVPLKVLWDSVVIEPDLQKWGITHGIEYDGGGSAVCMAHQLTDCIVAALEIMRQHGVSLSQDGYTTNWGGSQGSMPTLYFAKWYDTEAPQWFKDALRLKSSFIVEGVSIVPELTKHIYQDPKDFHLKPVTVVGYLKAFTEEQLGGYKPEDFVPQWWLDNKFQVNGKEITFMDAVCHYIPEAMHPLSETIDSYAGLVAPDMLQEDGQVDIDCPKIQAWLACLRKYNDVSGWQPAHDVYIAHAPADDMLPYKYAYDQYLAISNNGQNPMVHMLDVPSMRLVPHGGMNPHFIIAFMAQIIMAFVENPEDLKKVFKAKGEK